MSRAAALVSFVSASLLLSLGLPVTAQEAAPPVPAAPPVSPPPAPGSAPVIPVAPPLPGQLQAAPAMPPPAPGALPPAVGQEEATSPAPTGLSGLPPPTFNSAPSVPLTKPKARSSTSTSGQFIVHGDDLTLRSALSGKCEDIATELRNLLHDKQPWALPIVVLLNSGETARKAEKTASTVISQLTHGGFHIQVNVNMRPDLRPTDLRKEVIRALLAERILRDRKEITTQRKLLLPDWLFQGVLEALDYRQRARPSALFAAIFKSGKIFGIEEIIEASAADIDDALSKTIYQTSCCALVLALLDQPDSGLRVVKFLNALASDPRSERELLNQWFPNFASSEASLNKWWALQLATLASPGMAEPLSPQDTLIALEEALTFRYQAKPSEIPTSSRRVVAAVKPSAPKSLETEKPATKTAEPTPAETKVETEIATINEEPQEKRGFMSRLNPFSRRKSSDDEIAAAIEEAARVEAESSGAMPEAPEPPAGAAESALPEAPAPAPTTSGTRRKPLLDRWFDEDKPKADKPVEEPPLEEAKVTTPAPPKSATPAPTATVEKPKGEPEAKSEAEGDKKPSTLNPLNWFRGGKKEKEAKPEEPSEAPAPAPEKETKEKKTVLSQSADPLIAQLRSGRPIFALAMQEVAVEAPEEEAPAAEKKRLFGLFGKKKPKDDPAEPEAPKTQEEAPKPTKETKKAKEAPPAAEAPKEEPAKKESPEPKVDEAMPDAAAELESPKTKRQPVRLRLFGSEKKEEKAPEPEAEAQEEMPADTPPAPEPKPTAPSKPKEPAAAKPKSSKDEALVTASIPIEDYAAILKRKDLGKIMERNVNALAALQNRASVLYRPLVTEYVSAMEDILKGKTKGLDARLRDLRARTQEATKKTDAVRDLLDLHEANGAPAMSGLFEDYLKLPETIQNELPQRTDAISKYLDALDKEFSKE
ncbi:hypothetical protein [Prosthecobacter dejongeii]|uniref:Uncharacterized protein n=1 Tax=Prosthecobacter dejongeii TaxID=48465 RepID=A0A7W7YI08_9BACT|nr:hypothetical protein [Prosthecobacter dejongeii]MBB5036472.1 hypothetical protein [Prosthecobacter dejongeii]